MIKKHVVVTGRVQGVFFRDYTQKQAILYSLTGWVRNLPDGSVEALLCGEEEQVSHMLSWLRQGSPQSRVDSINIDDLHSTDIFLSFEILY